MTKLTIFFILALVLMAVLSSFFCGINLESKKSEQKNNTIFFGLYTILCIIGIFVLIFQSKL
jgi:hypothetical protein